MGTLRLGSSVVVPSVTINGGSQPVIDPLSITPTTSQQTITAPSGTDGYSPITVSAVTSSIDANITSGNIKSGVTILGVNGSVVELDGEQINITPTTSQQVITPTSPKNAITQATVSAVTSSIDANITAENIKKDVEILGVTGTYEGGGSATLITKTITANGIYDAADDSADGYSQVTVNVPTSGNTDILKSVVADGKTQLSGTPTPLTPVDIICNNGVLSTHKDLPEGYVRLEYLQGDGSAYLDLDLTLNVSDKVEIDFEFLENTTGQNIFGYRDSANSNNIMAFFAGSTNNIVLDFNNSVYGTYRLLQNISPDNKYKIYLNKFNRSIYNINNQLVGENSVTCNDTITTGNVYLFFAGGTPAQVLKYTGRIYGLKIDGKCNLIPAKRISDGVLGMYDIVSQTFFINAGTGNFIAGPIVIGIDGLSPNLLDSEHSNITLGYWLRNSDGTPESSFANFYTNAYIPVKPDTSYVCYGKKKSDNTLSNYNRIAWYDNNKTWIRNSTYTQGTIGVDTSPSNAAFARFHCNPTGATVDYSLIDSFNWTFREGSTEQDYIPYGQLTETITDFDGNKAVIEDLLSIDSNYTDTQNVVTGRITRKVGIKVLDGTETWTASGTYAGSCYTICSGWSKAPVNDQLIYCSHFQGNASTTGYEIGKCIINNGALSLWMSATTTASELSQFLADQYAAGTPVIVVYPLVTDSVEIVSPQILVHTPISTIGYLDNLVVNTIVYDSPVHYVEKRMVKINNLNTLTNSSPSGTSVPVAPISLKNVQNIDSYVFEDSHYLNPLILPRIGFIDGEDLRYITGNKACYRTFNGSNIVKTGLNYVEYITGEDACNSTFYSCTSLVDAGLERLVTIGASDHTTACQYMFYGNTALEKVDFKMLSSVGGNLACRYMFAGCTNLKELIYQSYINNSSTSSNIFNNMLQGVTGCTVHFPVASSAMSSWSDIVAGFGGTNTTILFDIVRTCTVGGNNYIRSPLDSVGDAIAFKLNADPYTIGYSIGEPNSGGYLYTTPECTTQLGYITSVS